MKKLLALSIIALFSLNINAQDKAPAKEDQINSALQAAPKEKRDEATVLGFDDKGNVVVLKKDVLIGDVIAYLKTHGIQSKNYFTPVHLQAFYKEGYGYKE